MAEHCLFVADGDRFQPTEWAVGPWSADTLQGSAYGGLLVRALERSGISEAQPKVSRPSDAGAGMLLARLSFDLWRPVTRDPLSTTVTVLREGRKARTAEASLVQGDKPVARCTAVYLHADAALTPPHAPLVPPAIGPEASRPVPPHVKAWSPFFTGVDTRVAEGDLLKPGPAAAWFNLQRPVVGGEDNSPVAHAVSAADLCSGISAIVDLRVFTFINADLTVLFWRVPKTPWILLAAETHAGDRGTGVARGLLSDVAGPFGSCTQTLLFDRRR
jgi:hypothetical protein